VNLGPGLRGLGEKIILYHSDRHITTCMWVKKQRQELMWISQNVNTEIGICQGCLLSPIVFNC